MQDLSFPIRDVLEPPAMEAQSLNHWTAREGPVFIYFLINIHVWQSQNQSLLFTWQCSQVLQQYPHSKVNSSHTSLQTEKAWYGGEHTSLTLPPPLQILSRLRKLIIDVLSRIQLFVTAWAVACQALLSMEFSRQEYLLLFPPWEDLPDPGIKFPSPKWAGGFFYPEPPRMPSL